MNKFSEVEGIDNIYAPVIICHLSIGITTVTVIKIIISFGRGASKNTTQGGIFDLNMYVTFDCAGIAAF